jgi:hypothetical protein
MLVVEAAGVEPDISVENTQLTDSGYASFSGNAMISKSTVQSLYSGCQKFPEPQPSDLLLQMRDTLKCSATFIHQSDPENRRRDQVSMFQPRLSARENWTGRRIPVTLQQLQFLDTSWRFKAKRKGENSSSLIEASARGVAVRI